MEENNISYGEVVKDAVNGYLAIVEDFAHRAGDAQGLAALNTIKGRVQDIVDIAIQDSGVDRVDAAIGVSIGIAVGMMITAPATLSFGAGLAVNAGYSHYVSPEVKDALNGLDHLQDTMNSNPDLNYPSLPAWMNGLKNMFDDATDTPDPILTLRNIGMRGGDPLILDLNGDGVELVQLADSTARFDVNGDDFATPTGWVNAEDGLLVLDKNSNGRIDNLNELFGDLLAA